MKVLAETPYFDLIKYNSKHGLHMKTTSVAILPYTVNESGIVETIGILKEWNPLRPDGYAHTLVTGTIEDSDEDAYTTAVRELSEETGISMTADNPDKWIFLGNFHDAKDTDRTMPTFAVDATGVNIGQPAPQNDTEAASTFEFHDVNEVIATSKETLVLAAFLRLFNLMYNKSFNNGK